MEMSKCLEKHKTLLRKAITRSIARASSHDFKYFRSYDSEDGSTFTVVATKECAKQMFGVECNDRYVVFKAEQSFVGVMELSLKVTYKPEFSNLDSAATYFVDYI